MLYFPKFVQSATMWVCSQSGEKMIFESVNSPYRLNNASIPTKITLTPSQEVVASVQLRKNCVEIR